MAPCEHFTSLARISRPGSVGLGGWVEEQVAVGLIGVGLLRAFGDFNQAGKDCTSLVEQFILIGEGEKKGHQT